MKYLLALVIMVLAFPAVPQELLMPEGYLPCPTRAGVCQVQLVGSHVNVIYGFPGKWTTPAVFDINFRCKEVNWMEPGTMGVGGVLSVPFAAPPGSICMVKPNS